MNKKSLFPVRPRTANAARVALTAALLLLSAPAALHAASVGVGATVMCAWWDSAARASAFTLGGSPDGGPAPAAAGGPFLTAQINDTWGVTVSYLYGKFTWKIPSFLLGYSAEDQRHDLDIIVSAAPHRYVRLFFGAKYWGTRSELTTNILFLRIGTDIVYHRAGPGAGLGLSLPLGAGFYLLPGISAVFMFGSISDTMGGPVSSIFGMLMKKAGSDGTAMNYGINSTLALAYTIEKANLTFALGGRFQYLWVYFIEAERSGDTSDMYAGLTFSAMYTFDIPGRK